MSGQNKDAIKILLLIKLTFLISIKELIFFKY